MKKLCFMLTVLFSVSMVVFAGGQKQDNASGKRTIAFATSTLNNPFMVTIRDTLQQLADERGDTLMVLDPQYNQATQISQIEDAVTRGVSAIFMIHVDKNGVRSGIERAYEAGIPVFGIDDPLIDTDLVVSNIYSNNHYAGIVGGQAMLKDFPNGAKIAIIDSPTMMGPVDRVNGFKEALGSNLSKFNIVAQQDGKATTADAQPIAENVLQAHPDIQAFFCINDPNALGVIAALRAEGKNGKVYVYSVDGSPAAKAELKSGDLRITAAQSPINLAKTTYETFEKFARGEQIEKEILVSTFGITAENVDEYTVDKWQ
ncbi:MAG: sugar ABC transporter substrate-binding protein [Spirochaetales bacterium]|jgi:ribose transport system substrate-binding protein|nr:sugar ABC transporter substrate-binding protein [Spirochaetales bacterium]